MADAVISAPADRAIDDPTRFQVGHLCALLESYLEPAQIERVQRAYLFGAQAHAGQTRLTGEPYIYHPLAVAHTMADMRMDADSIIAGILHDVIEDTPTAKEQLARELFEHPLSCRGCSRRMQSSDFRHSACGGMKVWIDPRVTRIEPDAPVTFVAPT